MKNKIKIPLMFSGVGEVDGYNHAVKDLLEEFQKSSFDSYCVAEILKIIKKHKIPKYVRLQVQRKSIAELKAEIKKERKEVEIQLKKSCEELRKKYLARRDING